MRRLIQRHRERGGVLQVILIILGVLLLLAVLVVGVVIWWLQRYVQVEVDSTPGKERVEISTPVGGLKVEKAEEVARRLKLPIYPGAQPTDESVAVEMHGELAGEEGRLDVVAAKFRSGDSLAQVDAWYRQQLGPEFQREPGRIIHRDRGESGDEWVIPKVEKGRGDGVVYSHEEGNRVRGVALERRGSGTKIALFDVGEAKRQ